MSAQLDVLCPYFWINPMIHHKACILICASFISYRENGHLYMSTSLSSCARLHRIYHAVHMPVPCSGPMCPYLIRSFHTPSLGVARMLHRTLTTGTLVPSNRLERNMQNFQIIRLPAEICLRARKFMHTKSPCSLFRKLWQDLEHMCVESMVRVTVACYQYTTPLYLVWPSSFSFHIRKEFSGQANTNINILSSVPAMLPHRQLSRKRQIVCITKNHPDSNFHVDLCRSQVGPMLAPWTLLSGQAC